MRTLLLAVLGAVGVVGLVACGGPCIAEDPIVPTPESVCLRGDAGAPAAGAPFTVFVNHNVGEASCSVGVDGGAIIFSLTRTSSGGSCGAPGGAAARAPIPATCVVPSLDAGTYSFNTTTAGSVTLPYDGGLPPCQF
ncbi:MAG: hypothetical protein QM817_13980 [Archangium sp.]